MITVAQMRSLERLAASRGIFPKDLMENAGKGVFEAVKRKYGLEGRHVVLFCGSGNNGGDGFVAAKYFAQECPVLVLFFGEKQRLSEEALENYEHIVHKVNVIKIEKKEDLDWFRFQQHLNYIFVDALVGTGVSGELREPVLSAIRFFNSLYGIKVAVDLPSGMDADTGAILGDVCQADLIIALHDLKQGMELVREKTIIVDIGIPSI